MSTLDEYLPIRIEKPLYMGGFIHQESKVDTRLD